MRKIYFFVAAATSFVFLLGAPVIALAAFVAGDPIITIANTNVRSSPEIIATNIVATVPAGTKGTIKDGPRIGSGRTDWYNIDYTGGVSGWSAAAYFKKDIPAAPGSSSPTVPGAEVLHCQLFAPQQVSLGQPFDITWTTSANTRQFTYRGGWGDFVSPVISPEPAPEQVLGDAQNGCLNTEGTADAKKCKITASLNTPGTYKGTFWAEGSGVNKPCTVYVTTTEEPTVTQSSSAFQITGPSQVQVGQPFTISYKKRSDIFYSSLFAWRGWQGAKVTGTAYQQTPASNDYPKAVQFFKGLQLPWLYSARIGEYPCQSGDCASMNVTVTEPGTAYIIFSLYADTGGLIGNFKYTVTATGSATPPPPPPPAPANTNCTASPATAAVGTPVTFTSTVGTPYVWVAAGGDPRSGTSAVFTTRFVEIGNQTVVGYKYDGTTSICNVTITGASTPPPPAPVPPPPPPSPTPPPPPPANQCPNNWNASSGGYYQKPGTSCPCQYFDANGGQPIGPAVSSSCSPVQQSQTPADTTGLNLSSQRFGSAQAGQIVWVKETTAPGVTDSGYYVYTGTDFPVGPEASWIKSYGGGTLTCQSGSFATKYGTLVTSSGGNANVFKLNGRSEEDGLFVWWRSTDGSYDWRRMTIDEYRAENGSYETIGRGNVPYAPNCVLNGTSNVQSIPLPHYFKVGDKIEVDAFKLRGGRDRLNVRIGPSGQSLGSEASLVGQQSAGMQGCVVDGKAVSINNLWYKIDFDSGVDGWVAPFIKKIGTCSTPQSPSPEAVVLGVRPTRIGENPQCPDGYFENRISNTSSALGVTHLLLPRGVTKTYCAEFKPPIAPATGDPMGVLRVSLYDESDQNQYSGGLKVQNPNGIIRGDNTVGASGGTDILFYSYISAANIRRPEQTPRGTYIITATGHSAGDARFRLGWDWQELAPPGAATASGSRVRVAVGAGSNLNVRAVAGGAVIGSQQEGAQGSVVAGPQSVNGVNWVQVNFDSGADGWVAQQFLQY